MKIRIFSRELEELLSEADSRKEGYVHYAGIILIKKLNDVYLSVRI